MFFFPAMDIVTSDSTENLFWPPGSDIPEAEKNGDWDPPGDKIFGLFEAYEKNGCLDLEWQCPERRVPTPEGGLIDTKPVVKEEVKPKEENTAAPDFMDFDFGDPVQSGGPFRIRTPGSGELKGGARKKTASMESVMSSIRKHGLTASPAPFSSPVSRAPTVFSFTPTSSANTPTISEETCVSVPSEVENEPLSAYDEIESAVCAEAS